MGYYINVERGEEMILPKETHEKIWAEGLPKCEAVLGDHISWCSPLAEYTQESTAERIREVLSDYGFDPVRIDDDGNIVIGGWGGDKIGSVWNQMWEYVITPHTKTDLTWLVRGEDGHLWAHAVRGNKQVQSEIVTMMKIGDEVTVL